MSTEHEEQEPVSRNRTSEVRSDDRNHANTATGDAPSLVEGNTVARHQTMCLAQEWQRDGRGLWAMRACQYYGGHTVGHAFGSWRYNVKPPGEAR
jgi:hypothetical protein